MNKTRCANCNASLGDQTYCGSCGQKVGHDVPTLGEFLHEWLHDAFTLDSKLALTLKPLLLKPGFLTQEYLSGRRARYARPLQLYLVASLLFFLLVALTGGPQFELTDKDNSTGLLNEGNVDTGIVDMTFTAPPDTAAFSPSRPDSNDTLVSPKLDLPDRFTELPVLGGRISRQEERFNDMGGREFLDRSSSEAGRHLPKMIFVLLPVFALILKLLYIRKGRLYLEHMVFGLHFHAFCFVVFLLAYVLAYIVLTPVEAITHRDMNNVTDVFQLLANVAIYIYLFKALRRVYGQGIRKTLLKFFLLLVIYNAVLGVSILLTMLLSAMLV